MKKIILVHEIKDGKVDAATAYKSIAAFRREARACVKKYSGRLRGVWLLRSKVETFPELCFIVEPAEVTMVEVE